MIIDPNVTEWFNLIARWTHVFAAIMWVGSTYYFTWLDGRLTEEEKAGAGTSEPAQVWMVHSGGFYVVEKRKKPGPRELHWFRWEAALTWLSGIVLLIHGYYMGSYLIDTDVRDISQWTGIAIGVGLLIVAWIVYDLLVVSPLGRNELLFAAISYALIVGVAYGLTHVLSGRAAYIHVGAMFGTIMVANVWMRILPAQRRMIAATRKLAATTTKQCPKCNRTYSDESLTFCLADGALLSAPQDAQATAQNLAPRNTNDAPTEVFPSNLVADSQTAAASSQATSEAAFNSTLAARAKLRSKHNTFMAVPVVFMMISNHYPVTTYGHDYNWIVLSIVVLLGWGAAKIIRRA
ncbi:MAG TPA: urate hydroxylase PuuD [Pyrinomonadaceae bacterium]|jgi:uncharacterized membrane protein